MIPLALTLQGFLSFREEQRLEFDQDQVWLLSGPNGSGKSTVFDAILFALYAGHRAGKADLHELINKDAEQALVRFEFLLGEQRYRAERLVERTADRKTGRPGYVSSQQLYAWHAGAAEWQPIAGTQKQGDFHEWVREHIGLSFDAFTSSALLMQGRADVLVAQDAEAARRRFEVLARLVGLDFYERLHRQADDLRKKNEKQVGELQAQLEMLEPVEPAKLAELAERRVTRTAELAEAEQRLELMHSQKAAATRWRELYEQRTAKQRDRDALAGVLGEAAAIERDGARHAELQAVLPGLERLMELRQQVADAEQAAAALTAEQQRTSASVAESTATVERLRVEVEALVGAQAKADAECQRWTTVQQRLTLAQPPLRRLFRQLEPLRQATAASAQLTQHQQAATAALRAQEQALAPLEQALTAATADQREAEQQAAIAQTRLSEFEEQARRFAQVAGGSVCSYCGQTLDAEHARRERVRLGEELDKRRAAKAAAQRAVTASVAVEEQCRQAVEHAEQALATASRQALELQRKRERAVEQTRTLTEAAREAYAEVPEPYRNRVGPTAPTDWTALRFPTAADLAELEQELARAAQQLERVQGEQSGRRDAIARLREQVRQAEQTQARHQAALAALDSKLIQQTERMNLGRQQLEPARTALPERWQYRLDDLDASSVQSLAGEVAGLVAKDAPGRLERLRAAQAAQEPLRQQLVALDELLVAVPAEARREPAELEPELRAAKQAEVNLRAELTRLDAELEQLQQLHERRERLAEDCRAADRRRHLSTRLATLLSRRHLQRHLLRQAEIGIVDSTNRVLDRITAGQLGIRLLPEEENDDNRALQLEAYKPAVQQSFGLSFLSGSERFRVAIGLALGIGQYASRQHRAIESVIIDEGFGCLDRDNRRTMIDELEHLRGQLRCILLVSHQEEFVEAFPDGYRFRIADGMTRVERAESP